MPEEKFPQVPLKVASGNAQEVAAPNISEVSTRVRDVLDHPIHTLKQEVDDIFFSSAHSHEMNEQRHRDTYSELQRHVPALESIPYEKVVEKKFANGKSIGIWALNTAHLLLPFFREHLLKRVEIEDKPLDREVKGSSCRVVEGRIAGVASNVALKIFIFHDLKHVVFALREGLDLQIAGNVNVGPRFFGFYVTPDGELALVMEKMDGFSLQASGANFVNEQTIEDFKGQIQRLRKEGYAFSGDGGEMLIGKDGSVQFVDVLLRCLDEDGTFEQMGPFIDPKTGAEIFPAEIVTPEKSDWYLRYLRKLSTPSPF